MRLSFPPAPSYYALGDDWATRESLRGEIACDVAVLGCGIAGCAAALHLAKRGYKVALLEARRVGYGASGRSGGQTIFGLAVSQQ
jgi:gamma-glutamylputrescine oxidase